MPELRDRQLQRLLELILKVRRQASHQLGRVAQAGLHHSIEQRPPAFSAIHIGGQRAYKLARRGEEVDIPTRTVRIDAIDLLRYHWPVAAIRVTCGKGTYIRSLARDLGRALGTGGHLASLRRTAVGPYTLDTAVRESEKSFWES